VVCSLLRFKVLFKGGQCIKQHGAAGIARRAHNCGTLRSLDRNEVLLLFSRFLFFFTLATLWTFFCTYEEN
jgi:hypothetical protein